MQQHILVVDSDLSFIQKIETNFQPQFTITTAHSLGQMSVELELSTPDIILLDSDFPKDGSYKAIEQFKNHPTTCHVPIILLTDSSEKENIHKGFSLGANDYFLKTFDTELLEKRIETLLCMNLQHNLLDTRKKDITELQNAIIETLTDTIEFRDEVTGGHVLRTQKHMEALIQGLLEKGFYTKTLSSWNLDYFIHSVQLHDVGKIGIPDNILKKCDRLTCEEFEIMKSHVVIGREIIQRIMKKTSKHEFLDFALAITISHHERWNGTGYPLGLKGTNIPLEGRLMALVDVYDALVSWRPYKDKKSHEKAMKIIEDESGTHFDPLIVEAFKHVEQRFKEIDLAFS